jgi:hypothetical protein
LIRKQQHLNFWGSSWGTYLLDPRVRDEHTREAIKFRLRFRVPYAVFKKIVGLCEDHKVFGVVTKHKRDNLPIELKVLVALRVLGQNATADNINELCGVGESSVSTIFKAFCHGFATKVLHHFVYLPMEGSEELKEVRKIYEKNTQHDRE